jgi:pseudouridine synthase
MSGMRLQKFLSAAGICSRRKGEELISSGKVRVNGKIVTELGAKVDPDVDFIEVDGQTAAVKKKYIYIALNKPKEYVTSCKHPGERIVLELVDIPERIYPIGRLDKDSTGLLLLTNDGRMHYQLTHPSFDHEKEYEVTVAQPITDGALRKMAEGVPMMAGKTRPSRIQRLSARRFRIVLKEGKNRQIRRMVRKMGNQVTGLHRIRVAEIRLGGLAPGAWRHLTEKEKLGLSKMR